MDLLPLLTKLLLLVSARLWPANGVAQPTYDATDPITGSPVRCALCPPGTFQRANCSSTKPSECAPCPRGSFTELWNYIGRCLRCGVCGRNQVVKKQCTANSDCQCECKRGYYYRQDYDMCVRHRECPSGQGVLTEGTAGKDTMCGVCSNGTFSDVSSRDQRCRQHKNCSDAGHTLLLKGAAWHDSVCANCAELQDGAAYLKEIIPAFFIHHNIKIKRLRRIVLKLPSDEARSQRGTTELSFSELHSRISSWVSSATPTQIRQLPELLIKTRASHAGEKLQKKLDRLNQSISKKCNLVFEADFR